MIKRQCKLTFFSDDECSAPILDGNSFVTDFQVLSQPLGPIFPFLPQNMTNTGIHIYLSCIF